MGLKSYTEQLEEVQEAISAVLLNQEYQIGDRRITRANLGQLQQREIYLQSMILREQNGLGTKVGWG